MDLSVFTVEVLVGVTLIAGFLSAIIGSSGIIVLPALMLAGVPVHFALGTNKLYTTASLFVSSFYYLKRGLMNPRYWVAAIIASAVGALLGAGMTHLFSADSLEKLVPIIVSLIAVYLLFHKKIQRYQEKRDQAGIKPGSLTSVVTSTILGIYSGFLDAGTGAIWTSVATVLFKVDLLEASAISRFMCFVTDFVALLVFIKLEEVHYSLGLILALCGSIGAFVGARVAVKLGGPFIRGLLIIVTIGMSVQLGLSTW